jgi:hypothetical protein
MVRDRLEGLAPGRLNLERVSRLRPDNPEIALLHDLVKGMKVHLPDGFRTNGLMPRSHRRKCHNDITHSIV